MAQDMNQQIREKILSRCVCSDCGINVNNYGYNCVDEYAFMVHDYLWPNGVKFLCISCLENRLGRELNSNDFNFDLAINTSDMFSRSQKLTDRLYKGVN